MSETTERRRRGRIARFSRWGVLLALLAFSTTLGLLHQNGIAWRPPGVDALCPFGGIEAAWNLITTGALIRRIAWSSVVLLGAVLLIAALFRRSFCGLICPLGTLQEIFGRLGRTIQGRRRLEVPKAVDRPARYLKYVVLAWFLGATWAVGELAIRPYDPWVAYHHLFSDELLTAFAGGTIVLAVSVAGSLVYDRFFCKYLCPMGAVLAALAPFGRFRITRDTETCTDCKLCDKACPTNVMVSTADDVSDVECINCNECVTVCPVDDCLQVATPKGAHVTPLVALGSVVAIFALVIGIFTATGDFAWEAGRGGCGGESGGSGAGNSSVDPTDSDDPFAWIRGSATFTDISATFDIPAATFTSVFGVPDDAQRDPLAYTKDVYGFSPGEVRAFTAAYVDDPGVAETWGPGSFADDCE